MKKLFWKSKNKMFKLSVHHH